MANLFDFHLFPEPVEHTAVLLTGVKCVRSRAAACSLPPPLWSGERLLQELQPGSQGSTSLPAPRPAPSKGEGSLVQAPWVGRCFRWGSPAK